jgi:hypothetical protein
MTILQYVFMDILRILEIDIGPSFYIHYIYLGQRNKNGITIPIHLYLSRSFYIHHIYLGKH